MKREAITYCILMLVGCATSKHTDLTKWLEQRNEAIMTQLPVVNGHYALIKAETVSDDTLQLVIMDNRSSTVAEKQRFMQELAHQLCIGSEDRSLLTAGGKYQLVLRDEGQNQQTLIVDQFTCHYE